MLIGHKLYGDDHAGSGAGGSPELHGPYLRDRITPDCFDLTDAGVEETPLRGWAEQYVPLTADVRASLDRELYQSLRAAGRVYRLRDFGPPAYHDWGWIRRVHELVLLDHAAGTLSMVVATDD